MLSKDIPGTSRIHPWLRSLDWSYFFEHIGRWYGWYKRCPLPDCKWNNITVKWHKKMQCCCVHRGYNTLCFWKVYVCLPLREYMWFTRRRLGYPDWLVLFSESEGWKRIIVTEERKYQLTKAKLHISVTCHLPYTYMSSGPRVKLNKQLRFMLKQIWSVVLFWRVPRKKQG